MNHFIFYSFGYITSISAFMMESSKPKEKQKEFVKYIATSVNLVSAAICIQRSLD